LFIRNKRSADQNFVAYSQLSVPCSLSANIHCFDITIPSKVILKSKNFFNRISTSYFFYYGCQASLKDLVYRYSPCRVQWYAHTVV